MLTLLAAAALSLGSMSQAGAFDGQARIDNLTVLEDGVMNDKGTTWRSYRDGYVLTNDRARTEVADFTFWSTAESFGLHVGPRRGGEAMNYSRRAKSWANRGHYGYGLRHR